MGPSDPLAPDTTTAALTNFTSYLGAEPLYSMQAMELSNNYASGALKVLVILTIPSDGVVSADCK